MKYKYGVFECQRCGHVDIVGIDGFEDDNCVICQARGDEQAYYTSCLAICVSLSAAYTFAEVYEENLRKAA